MSLRTFIRDYAGKDVASLCFYERVAVVVATVVHQNNMETPTGCYRLDNNFEVVNGAFHFHAQSCDNKELSLCPKPGMNLKIYLHSNALPELCNIHFVYRLAAGDLHNVVDVNTLNFCLVEYQSQQKQREVLDFFKKLQIGSFCESKLVFLG